MALSMKTRAHITRITVSILSLWLSAALINVHAGQLNPIAQPPLQRLLLQTPDALAAAPTYLKPNQLANLQRFYAARAYQLAWINTYQAWSNPVNIMLDVAQQHGLNTNHHPTHLLNLIAQSSNDTALNPDKLLLRDLSLSTLFMTLSQQLAQGVAPQLGKNILYSTVTPRVFNAPQLLENTLQQPNLAHALNALAPNHPAYLRLQKALAFYQTLAQNGGWQTDPNTYLNPENVRQRLSLTGDYHEPNTSNQLTRPGQNTQPAAALSWHWDDEPDNAAHNTTQTAVTISPEKIDPSLRQAALEQAIRSFQQRHHLTEDGALNLKTRAQLAISVHDKIARIRANLERWRWFEHSPNALNSPYIEVNIANFSLNYVHSAQNDARNIAMKAVVGTPQRKTPIMESTLNHLVFNPYWRIPKTILMQDILPKLKKNVGYLNAHNIKLFNLSDQQERYPLDPYAIDWQSMSPPGILNYRFRQDAGPKNALGTLKFMFPNHQDIYIHDTPVRSTFTQLTRLASSGCVRAEKPKELAYQILSRQHTPTSHAMIDDYLQSNQQRTVWLKEPIPVYLTYQTLWADESGRLFSRPDVYKYDTKLLDLFRNQP